MTEQTKNLSSEANYLQKYLQKYNGTERRNDKIKKTALLDLNFNFSLVHSLHGDKSNDRIEKLLLMVEERLHQRLRDTDVILRVNHKLITLLEEVEIIAHANFVSNEIVAMLKAPFNMSEASIELETTIGINLFSKLELQFAAFPRKIKLD